VISRKLLSRKQTWPKLFRKVPVPASEIKVISSY
jgi:hypothetical protein